MSSRWFEENYFDINKTGNPESSREKQVPKNQSRQMNNSFARNWKMYITVNDKKPSDIVSSKEWGWHLSFAWLTGRRGKKKGKEECLTVCDKRGIWVMGFMRNDSIWKLIGLAWHWVIRRYMLKKNTWRNEKQVDKLAGRMRKVAFN